MKIFVFVLIAALGGTKADLSARCRLAKYIGMNCAVVNEIGEFDGTTEALETLGDREPTVDDVKSLFDAANGLIPGDKSFFEPLAKSLIRSVDAQCMIDIYKKHDMMHRFPRKNFEEASSAKISAFATSAVLCSSKFGAVGEFQFELLMSFRFIYKVFSDDPEFSEYFSMLKCANKYAVDHKLLDPIAYNISYHVDDDKLEECDGSTFMILQMLQTSFWPTGDWLARRCAKELIEGATSFLKFVLLIQVDLTEEERVKERANSAQQLRDYFDVGIQCFTEFENIGAAKA